eukprot:CCRYP_015450-RA/>CCRYP_015450-RA protein AED:0.04 eAED:0.04 QI:990/1/1/1/0.6/0.33/6/238/882
MRDNGIPHSILPPAGDLPASTKSAYENAGSRPRNQVHLSTSLESSSQTDRAYFSLSSGQNSIEHLQPANQFHAQNTMKFPYVSDIEQNNDTKYENVQGSIPTLSPYSSTASKKTNTGPPAQGYPAMTFSMKLPPPPGIGSHEMTPDDAWLYEVLGVDMNGARGAIATKPSHSKTTAADAQEQTKSSQNHVVETKFPATTAPVASETKANVLDDLSQDQLSEARRAAFELRLESQQKGAFANNDELLSTLLQLCRSNQLLIVDVLERSTSLAGTDDQVDESHVEELLELNELLLSSISMAESRCCFHDAHKCEPAADKTNATQAPPDDRPKSPKRKKKSRKNKSVANSKDSKAIKVPVACSSPPEVLEEVTMKSESSNNAKAPNTKLKETEVELLCSTYSNAKRENTALEPTAYSNTPNDALSENALKGHASNNGQEPKGRDNVDDPADAVQQEKDRMLKLLEEERRKAAVAREKKKSKKAKRFDRWVKEQEELKVSRGDSWKEWISKEIDYTELIKQLLVTEFLRQTKNTVVGVTNERILSDTHEVLMSNSRQIYRVLFGEVNCRVVVAGTDNTDLNGRQGNLHYYDKERQMFCVGLDTKKSSDSEIQFFSPENLDRVAARSFKSDKAVNKTFDVNVPAFFNYGDVMFSLIFTIKKSHVTSLGSAESLKLGLEKFIHTRNDEEHRAKLEAEAEKKREDVDRKRRKEAKARERAAWEHRKEAMRREKEEFEEMRREWARERRKYAYDQPFGGYGFFENIFSSTFGNNFTSSGGSFYFTIGGIPFRFRMDDDSDGDSFFDDFDDRWEERLEEEKEEENRKCAEILGVPENADARTLKLAYRKMALQYHPDKWKSDSEHGMTKEDAEERFKTMQSAYDHLMSNFD